MYGCHFMIESDHGPLSYLYNEAKEISQTASSHIQRWTHMLSAYQYTIRHKAGKSLSNAHALSRLPRPVTTSSDKTPGDFVHLLDHLSSTTVTAEAIKDWIAKDPILSNVRRYIMSDGWILCLLNLSRTRIGPTSSALLTVVCYGELELLYHHKDMHQCWMNSMRPTLNVQE